MTGRSTGERTQQEVAEVLGVSRARVMQIEQKAFAKMRAEEQAQQMRGAPLAPHDPDVVRLERREADCIDEMVQREANGRVEDAKKIRHKLIHEVIAAGILVKRRERGLAP